MDTCNRERERERVRGKRDIIVVKNTNHQRPEDNVRPDCDRDSPKPPTSNEPSDRSGSSSDIEEGSVSGITRPAVASAAGATGVPDNIGISGIANISGVTDVTGDTGVTGVVGIVGVTDCGVTEREVEHDEDDGDGDGDCDDDEGEGCETERFCGT